MRRAKANPWLALLAVVIAGVAGGSAFAAPDFPQVWPDPAPLRSVAGESVRFASSSPFVPSDIGEAEPVQAQGRLFLPPGASAGAPVPAAVLLHGAAGVLAQREIAYARQLAAIGVAALVVDSFAARRGRATGFVDRLMKITETMVVADAYAALSYLATRPEVDAARVALIGFSYGGMAATYAAYRQTAEAFAPDGPRFAGHVAFYGPCIARFSDPTTTGAPVLMLWGGRDALIDPARCAEIADDLRRGGSRVETVVYPEAVHQWDGAFAGPRPIGRNLAPCEFRVGRDGRIWSRNTYLPMVNSFTRKLNLGLCAEEEGYLIGRDDAVRARSNRDLGAFLEEVLRERG